MRFVLATLAAVLLLPAAAPAATLGGWNRREQRAAAGVPPRRVRLVAGRRLAPRPVRLGAAPAVKRT
jgi:hypothetical protein